MIERTESFLGNAFSTFLAERSDFQEEEKEKFVRIVRALIAGIADGHTCMELDSEEKQLVSCYRLASDDGKMPLVLSDNRLYLARYFHYELRLASQLHRLAARTYAIDGIEAALDSCFPLVAEEKDWQREAARIALCKGLCIISGGPGTGKTTTIVKIVSLLLGQIGTDLRIALAAPTGKAAMRLKQSVSQQLTFLSLEDEVRDAIPTEAHTLHRLLGVNRFSPRFQHSSENPMVWDVVIVDEASMIDLALMSKLVDALDPDARLILLGDKDQLASVESGSVLSDCIQALEDNVVELRTAWRFNEGISKFAGYVNRGNTAGVAEMLVAGAAPSIVKAGDSWLEDASMKFVQYMKKARLVKGAADVGDLFSFFSTFRILCAVRHGSYGVSGINERIERLLAQQGFECGRAEWYIGRPVIITRNDYSLGLFNGDIGICLPDFNKGEEIVVWFEQDAGQFRRCAPARLPVSETVWAMTVHKSQGSEFDEVMVVLPEKDNPVICRELLYTAVTRARNKVTLVAGKAICEVAVRRRMIRQSGLAEQLTRLNQMGRS